MKIHVRFYTEGYDIDGETKFHCTIIGTAELGEISGEK